MAEVSKYNPDIKSQPGSERRASSKRLMLSIEALLKTQVSGEPEIQGIEHLAGIPKGRKIIIATSHISDIDIPLSIKAVGYNLDLKITNESVHHSFLQEAGTNIGLHISGKKNYIPIDFEKTTDGKKS